MINSDSLHTWALAGLAAVAGTVQLEILREDQDYSLELLRSGAAAAAITTTAKPAPGCSSRRLGVMRYLPVCSPDFAGRWFAAGVTAETLGAAPVLGYDRKDDLQDRYLRKISRKPLHPPRHYVPPPTNSAKRSGSEWAGGCCRKSKSRPTWIIGGWSRWPPRATSTCRCTGSSGAMGRRPWTRWPPRSKTRRARSG